MEFCLPLAAFFGDAVLFGGEMKANQRHCTRAEVFGCCISVGGSIWVRKSPPFFSDNKVVSFPSILVKNKQKQQRWLSVESRESSASGPAQRPESRSYTWCSFTPNGSLGKPKLLAKLETTQDKETKNTFWANTSDGNGRAKRKSFPTVSLAHFCLSWNMKLKRQSH